MIDYFALLQLPRRPWLDLANLQEKFLSLSAEVHPDRVPAASVQAKAQMTESFAVLNAAYQCLREPTARLRHLLELESGRKLEHLERLPSAAMDFYLEMGRLCRQIDDFLARKAAVESPLLKVRTFEQAMAWREQLEQAKATLKSRLVRLEDELQRLNPLWAAAPEPGAADRQKRLPLDHLEQLYREMSYLSRWQQQTQERMVQLSF